MNKISFENGWKYKHIQFPKTQVINVLKNLSTVYYASFPGYNRNFSDSTKNLRTSKHALLWALIHRTIERKKLEKRDTSIILCFGEVKCHYL